jgi:hypothetical protein
MSVGDRRLGNLPQCFCFYFLVFSETSPLLLTPLNDPMYQPSMIDGNECGTIGEMKMAEKLEVVKKICPSSALFVTNPT